MKMSAKWSVVLIATVMTAAVMTAAEVEPKILRLIGPGTKFVYGMDLDRYAGSQLSKFFAPTDHLLNPDEENARPQLGRVIGIGGSFEDEPLTLTITAMPMPPFEGDAVTLYRGVRVREHRDRTEAGLDTSTVLTGRSQQVKDAIERWGQEGAVGEIAAKVRQLGRTYDIWFLAIRPLDRPGETPPKPQLKYRAELAEAIEEVRIGVRLGAINDVTVEVVTKSADDPMALAVIGRYLPGIVESGGPFGLSAGLIAASENILTRAEGRTASLSFSVVESRLVEWIRAQKKHGIE